MVSGAEGWKDIAAFGRIELDWLRQFLPYVYGIPSDDCIACFKQVPVSYFEQTDAGHGCCEARRHWLVNDLSTLPAPERCAKLQSIGTVESERHEGG